MMISYSDAVSIVRSAGQNHQRCGNTGDEIVQLADSLGRRASQDVISPIDTPLFDSSAMDGYAVSSALTAQTTPARMLCLRVVGTIAAGDPPLHLPCDVDEHGSVACVEIMTGAPFPQSSLGPSFDACIPWEHTEALPSVGSRARKVQIMRAPKPNQNRRFAGEDFRKGDIVVTKEAEIGPHHVMAMASVGIGQVLVRRRIQATIMTTGNELLDTQRSGTGVKVSTLHDCNGPFLYASLRSLGIEVKTIPGVSDDVKELQASLTKAVSSSSCDILITTGGVSAGKFDFVPEAILNLGGKVHFHHVAMRPGHPVLFASLPRAMGQPSAEVPLFGLPGNPVAAAACYRFLVVPYLRALQGQGNGEPICAMEISTMKYRSPGPPSAHVMPDDDLVYQKDEKLDAFCPAHQAGSGSVSISNERSPSKVRPFASANCWIHIRAGISNVRIGDKVDCYSLNGSTTSALVW